MRGDIERVKARDDVRHSYETALALHEQTHDVQGQLDTLLKLGELEYDANNFDAARRHYKIAISLSKEADDPQAAHAFMSLGDVEDAAGNSDQAGRHFEKALVLCSDDLSAFEDEEDTEGQVDTLLMMGDLEARLGNIEGARKRYKAALSLLKEEDDVLGLAQARLKLGDLEMEGDEAGLDVARGYYERALSAFEDEEELQEQAETLLKLGDLELEYDEADLDEAREHYEKALSLFEEEEALQGQAETLLKLGDLESEYEGEDLDEAREHYLKALSCYTQAKDPEGRAETFMKLGALEVEADNPDDARGHYEAALSIFKVLRDLQGQADAFGKLGDLGGLSKPSVPSAAPRLKTRAATRPTGSTIFICYAHADNAGSESSRWLDQLKTHLKPLAQRGLLAWSDQRIEVGQEWHEQIQDILQQAKAAVLLVSPDFVGSDYIREHELPQLLHRKEQGQLQLIPLLLRPALLDVDFKYPHHETGPHSLRLGDLQFVHGTDQALNGLDQNARDKVLLDVAKRLMRIADEND
ncbi:tetratricopeptide repeat protein [Pyxidicoccus caerfyrddinensis]|uniref:tetratricopeptide repeat protein n=1 Tax=Pyxidicoccus caerfyrddinensis TaxID=2709663 RepID=UPI0013DCDF6B|nr:tetratricopeptide repeat protein [Pyxidicoccus caerfyrddinensis]